MAISDESVRGGCVNELGSQIQGFGCFGRAVEASGAWVVLLIPRRSPLRIGPSTREDNGKNAHLLCSFAEPLTTNQYINAVWPLGGICWSRRQKNERGSASERAPSDCRDNKWLPRGAHGGRKTIRWHVTVLNIFPIGRPADLNAVLLCYDTIPLEEFSWSKGRKRKSEGRFFDQVRRHCLRKIFLRNRIQHHTTYHTYLRWKDKNE
ncbi:hypothetical protein B0H15DRAFT_245674 [Mycena belliarum]|uniref:Uncharacterized protein n=1 Tax=Mycena belliarum TaxID=1033014 RepID=A0AAD6UA84_9AGAR|nr:hypothetical protein B0H15DRAFT_245674 [Mycena belliae]